MPTALRRPPGAALALAVALLAGARSRSGLGDGWAALGSLAIPASASSRCRGLAQTSQRRRLLTAFRRSLPATHAGLCWRAAADVSRPGGAGHALLFRDHGVVLPNFKDLGEHWWWWEHGLDATRGQRAAARRAPAAFCRAAPPACPPVSFRSPRRPAARPPLPIPQLPDCQRQWVEPCHASPPPWPPRGRGPSHAAQHLRLARLRPAACAAPDALTFEAWLSTTDFCHASALMSYALDSQARVGRVCGWTGACRRGGRGGWLARQRLQLRVVGSRRRDGLARSFLSEGAEGGTWAGCAGRQLRHERLRAEGARGQRTSLRRTSQAQLGSSTRQPGHTCLHLPLPAGDRRSPADCGLQPLCRVRPLENGGLPRLPVHVSVSIRISSQSSPSVLEALRALWLASDRQVRTVHVPRPACDRERGGLAGAGRGAFAGVAVPCPACLQNTKHRACLPALPVVT